MNWSQAVALAQQYLPAGAQHKALEAFGGLALAYRAVLDGGPGVTRAADWLTGKLLNSPLRPLVLYFAPGIANFLDKFTAALVNLATTFKNEIEKDLTAAKAAQAK